MANGKSLCEANPKRQSMARRCTGASLGQTPLPRRCRALEGWCLGCFCEAGFLKVEKHVWSNWHTLTNMENVGLGCMRGQSCSSSTNSSKGGNAQSAAQLHRQCCEMAMGHNLCLHLRADEHPCTTYIDVHQGYRVLTHSQVALMFYFLVRTMLTEVLTALSCPIILDRHVLLSMRAACYCGADPGNTMRQVEFPASWSFPLAKISCCLRRISTSQAVLLAQEAFLGSRKAFGEQAGCHAEALS